MIKFYESRSAVSPVIGVILIIAITVIVSTIIAASVLLFESADKAPYAIVEIKDAMGGTDKALGNNLIELYHRGGENLLENDTRIILTGSGYAYTGIMPTSSQQDIEIIYYDLSGFNYGGTDGHRLGEIVNGDTWNPGETVLLNGYDGKNINSSITGEQGNNVNKKWMLTEGSMVSITIIDIKTNQVIAALETIVKPSG